MTLLARTTARANRANRATQHRAERRLDEIVKVAGIADDYQTVDRAGDLAIEKHFAALYQLVDTQEEREAVAAAFATWQACERREEYALRGSVDDSVTLLKSNNPFWINGSATPDDSDGAA